MLPPKCDGSEPLPWLAKLCEYFEFYEIPLADRLHRVTSMLEGSALSWFIWRMRGGLIDGWEDFVEKFKIRFAPLHALDYISLAKTSEKARDTFVHMKKDLVAFSAPTVEDIDALKGSSTSSHIKDDDYSGSGIIDEGGGALAANYGANIERDEPSNKSDSTSRELYVPLNASVRMKIAEYEALASMEKVADADKKQVANLISFDDTIKLFDLVDVVNTEHLVSPRATTYAMGPVSFSPTLLQEPSSVKIQRVDCSFGLALSLQSRSTSGSLHLEDKAFEKVLVNVTGVAEENLQSLFHAGLKSHLQHEIMLHKPGSLSASFALTRELEVKYLAWTSALPTRSGNFREAIPAKPTAPAQAVPLLPSLEAKPPPRATPTTGLPVRRLSYAERKARDAKGLCYNCDEKWVKGHSCGRFLLLLEDDDEEEILSSVDDTVLSADVSSLHSLVMAPRSLRMSGMLGAVVVDVLIDGGSTHNFVHTSLVARAQLPVSNIPPFRVYVGNDESLLCTRQCLNVSLLLQGFQFTVDVYVLPIHGPDMVLGVQWLQLLGRVTHDYANLIMEFTWQDKAVSLRGDPISPKPVSLHHFNGLCTANQVAACYELLIFPSPNIAPAEGEHWPTDLPEEIEMRKKGGIYGDGKGTKRANLGFRP
ncbi:unnamed protein product [Cuscuta campestris]|uniref:Retrotransposon gag domain-containing protein n=1 Tax=Cuscuta campestris TaxID=132261 RepID=A0A484LQI0_9ASTE|nr:unnamed protein product [Cuscuta campestris]